MSNPSEESLLVSSERMKLRLDLEGVLLISPDLECRSGVA